MSLRISLSKRWAGAIAASACALLAAPAAASANGYNDTVLADGPLAYYELNESSGTTALDATPNHVDGTYSGTFTLGVGGPFALAGNAVSFNGAGEVDASLTGAVHTAELWVKPSVKNAQMSFITHGDPSSDGWTIGIGARRKLVFKTGGKTVNSNYPVGYNRWTMVDVAWTSTSVSFALNGGQTQFKSKVLPVAAPGPANTSLVVGNGPLGAVKGALDEVALYPTALTRTQMGSHFTATGLPINTVAPVVTGVPRQGDSLTVTPGTWTGATAPATYQWQQCDPVTGDCSDIPGATGTTLLLDSSEVGYQIQVIETESNGVGPSSVTSNLTAPVVAIAGGPVNVTAPAISGSAVEGQILTADPGTWDPSSGLTFSYQWQRCDVDGENCSPIGGATAQTYTLASADVGSTVIVTVSADDGSHPLASADSDPTAVVTDPSSGGGSGSGDGGAGNGGATGGSTTATGAAAGTPVACPARLASIPKRISKRRHGLGKVGLRFKRGTGASALKATLKLNRKRVRSVEYRLGAKRVKRLRRAPFGASIPAKLLKPGTIQTLKVIVTPRHGSKLALKVRLRVAACS